MNIQLAYAIYFAYLSSSIFGIPAIFSLLSYFISKKKGANKELWALLGFFLGPIILIFVLLLNKKPEKDTVINLEAHDNNLYVSEKKYNIKPTSIIFGVLLVPWFIMILPTLMMSGAPGSGRSILTTALMFSMLLYGPVYVVSLFIALDCKKNNEFKKSFFISFVPLVNLIIAVIAFALLELLCDGQFACY